MSYLPFKELLDNHLFFERMELLYNSSSEEEYYYKLLQLLDNIIEEQTEGMGRTLAMVYVRNNLENLRTVAKEDFQYK